MQKPNKRIAAPIPFMTPRPAIDTAEAIRTLQKHDLDPELAEALVRLVDCAVQNSAASQVELLELRLHIEKSEQRVAGYVGLILGMLAIMLGLVANFDEFVAFFAG